MDDFFFFDLWDLLKGSLSYEGSSGTHENILSLGLFQQSSLLQTQRKDDRKQIQEQFLASS